jgi:prepilin-type N-terminal cleavage/methylation domain-containing protein
MERRQDMKRGFTLIEMLTVVIVLSILATVSLPIYNRVKKRIEYRETSGVLELVRAGAKYYDLKYGISVLSSGDPAWTQLKVDKPAWLNLVYSIEDSAGTKYMRIRNKNNNLLYSYRLPDGPGSKTAHADTAYLPADLP